MRSGLIVHPGLPKCGSKSLQGNFFLHHPEVLLFTLYTGTAEARVLGRQICDHLVSPSRVYDESGACRAVEKMFETAAAAGRRPVLSVEGLTSTHSIGWEQKAQRLRAVLKNRPAKILLVIRHPYSLSRSVFFQRFIYGPPPESGEAVLSNWLGVQLRIFETEASGNKLAAMDNLRFFDIWTTYSRAFGEDNVVVIPLETMAESDQSVFHSDLCRQLGLANVVLPSVAPRNRTVDKKLPRGVTLDTSLDENIASRLLSAFRDQIVSLDAATGIGLAALGYLKPVPRDLS